MNYFNYSLAAASARVRIAVKLVLPIRVTGRKETDLSIVLKCEYEMKSNESQVNQQNLNQTKNVSILNYIKSVTR